MPLDLTDDKSTSVNKPLPEPMLTQICVDMVSLRHNELNIKSAAMVLTYSKEMSKG